VLTEDNYFDFLIGVTSNKALVPEQVRRALSDSSLMFLGFHAGARKYLEDYFGKSAAIDLFWGSAEEFLSELDRVWKGGR
jgi:hypothetical protein